METLFSFFLLVGLIVILMMRVRFSLRPVRQEHSRSWTSIRPNKDDGPELLWVPPAKDIDPVCGKTVTSERAKSSVYSGHVYYFCSRECREVFEAAPDLYVDRGAAKSACKSDLYHGRA
jgi:YHS domain-containing protein